MNIKQQLEQVIAEMRDYARQAWSPEVEEWVPRLSAIVEVMDKVEPVAWMFSRAYGNGLSFARPDDYEDEDGSLVTPTPLYAAPQVPDGMVLPCDVRLPPNLIIRKGCKIETLMEALKVRDGRDVRWADPKEAARSPIATAKEEADEANPS